MSQVDDHFMGALLEEINERLKGMNEGIDALAEVPQRLTKLENTVAELAIESKATRFAIKDISKVLDNHGTRLTRLETA